MESLLSFILGIGTVKRDEILVDRIRSNTVKKVEAYRMHPCRNNYWRPMSLGSDLPSNIQKRVVVKGACFRCFMGGKQDRLTQVCCAETMLFWYSRFGERINSCAYCPSKYQGFIREKSVSWDSFGNLLRCERTN